MAVSGENNLDASMPKAQATDDDGYWGFLFGAWLVAVIATGGSLFFSEVMKFPPCVLCWYQRIGMYPLVLIFLVGLVTHDRKTLYYALPLMGVGSFFALYHNLLHFGIIPESASPCVMGVPCSTVYIQWFGFVTIPLLSLLAYALLWVVSMVIYKRYLK